MIASVVSPCGSNAAPFSGGRCRSPLFALWQIACPCRRTSPESSTMRQAPLREGVEKVQVVACCPGERIRVGQIEQLRKVLPEAGANRLLRCL
jgi:hypothetical protein